MEPYILSNLIEGGVGLLAGTAAGYMDSKVRDISKLAEYVKSHKLLRSTALVLLFDGFQTLLEIDSPNTWLAEPLSDAVQGDAGGVVGLYLGLYFGQSLGRKSEKVD